MNRAERYSKTLLLTGLLLVALALGLFTTLAYVDARGLAYLETGNQIQRHQAVLDGTAGNPWQYRVLATYLVNLVLVAFEDLHVPHSTAAAFMLARLVQDTSILLLAFMFYRRLGLPCLFPLLGMALLAWSIGYSHFDSDLSFSVFFDVIFYLLAGLCIFQGKNAVDHPYHLPGCAQPGNERLIPFLLLSSALFAGEKRRR